MATLLVSYWLGEHNTELFSIDGLLAGLPAAVILPFMLWGWRKWCALLAPFAILFVSIGVWIGGAAEGIYAQNECYERTPTGYHMWFGDKLVSHDATEAQAFIAHK